MNRRTLSADQLLDLASDVIARGGRFAFQARGHSMSPSIRDGDRVEVGPLQGRAPQLGDVVLAQTPAGVRLHRVVASGVDPRGRWLVIRGDAQAGPGERIRTEDVVARLEDSPLHRPGSGAASILVRIARRLAAGGERPA